MKTKFADFIRLIYGEQYLDDSYVQLNRNNLKIVGLNEDLVFFNHSWLEGEGKKSKINITEAEMITGMVQYLTEVAYQQQQITVLSFYLRQAQLIQKNLIRNKLSKVKVQTVDNYQGEENDIVIISLVRNNSQKKLGFILNNNRINVALSRARIGLYIFGNFDFIKKAAKSDSLWQKIIDMAQAKNCLSKFITLKCLKHGTLRKVYQPNDWLKYQAGCCDKICDYNFEGCYHRCKKECHLSNHQLEKCPEQCGRSLECGHICEQQCIQPCSCTKKILVKLPNCSHEALICCSQDPLQILCQQDLQLTQQNCSHIYNYKCSEKESVDPQCQYECKRVLQCGHICKKKCWQECQPCEDYCETVKYCGHKCYSLCQQPFSSCDQEICIKLDCGRHIIKKSCFQMQNLLMINLNLSPQFFRSQIGQKYLKDLFQRLAIGQRDALQIFNNKAEFECRAPCQKPRECGHIFQCKNLCTEVCTPCGLQIPVTLECGHQYQIFCKNKDAFLNNFQCKKQCTRQYACGHQQKCKQLCFEQCTPCQELVLKHSNCGHSIRTQCFNNYICKKKCTRRRNCGHQDPCLNKCGYECSPCQEIVNWLLVCGHFKEMKCFSTNFECTMPCQRQRTCMHNFPCYNQCSEQCTACQQVILWTLSCGHQIYVQCWVFQAYQQQGLYGDTFQCKICQQNF